MVSLSIVIPTPGQGRPLKRCLRSIASQGLALPDEVLVVGDTTDGELPEVQALVERFGRQYRYLSHVGAEHTFGHDQINRGIAEAQPGHLLVFQDDDDVFTEGAFDAIREAAQDTIDKYGEPRPLMFRFVTRFRTLVWGASPVLAQDHVGGHCFVVPNRKEYLGTWAPHYQGDWTAIRTTLDKWPGGDSAVVWREEVIALARPNTPEHPE
jgi:glycosyltransferase involved in cell wall biosynthesis